MAGSVNTVILLGNLTRDPEVRSFANGGKVCNMTVATSETWKDKTTGERKERSEFHRVAIMNEPLVNVAEKYLKKGSKVYLSGQLETRKWTDQSGAEKFSTEIVLRPYKGELTLLDAREGGSSHAPAGGGSGSGDYRAPAGGGYGSSGGRSVPDADLDQDVPF